MNGWSAARADGRAQPPPCLLLAVWGALLQGSLSVVKDLVDVFVHADFNKDMYVSSSRPCYRFFLLWGQG